MDHVYENEIEERHVSAEQKHGDNDDEGRIGQLLVFAEPFFIRIPRPGSFLKLDLHLAKEAFNFSNHGTLSVLLLSILRSGKSRQEGLEPPTGGFGDRYSTN